MNLQEPLHSVPQRRAGMSTWLRERRRVCKPIWNKLLVKAM